LALDDTLGEAHAVLAGVLENEFQWEAAEREFRRALELNPDDARTLNWYAFLLAQLGRYDESIEQAKRAVALEPLNLKYSDTLGVMYRCARQYSQSVEQLKKTLDMDAGYAPAVNNLASAQQALQHYDLWLEGWKKAVALSGDKEELAIAEESAQVYSESGYRAACQRRIALYSQLSKKHYVDPGSIALIYGELGDNNQTFAWLDRAYAEKSDLVSYVKTAWELDKMHSDPRYAALLKKMGLPK